MVNDQALKVLIAFSVSFSFLCKTENYVFFKFLKGFFIIIICLCLLFVFVCFVLKRERESIAWMRFLAFCFRMHWYELHARKYEHFIWYLCHTPFYVKKFQKLLVSPYRTHAHTRTLCFLGYTCNVWWPRNEESARKDGDFFLNSF